jgi:hypothetical protein
MLASKGVMSADQMAAWAKETRHKCEARDTDRCEMLGEIYLNGKGVPKDERKALDFFEKTCNEGDMGACLDTGEPSAWIARSLALVRGDVHEAVRMSSPGRAARRGPARVWTMLKTDRAESVSDLHDESLDVVARRGERFLMPKNAQPVNVPIATALQFSRAWTARALYQGGRLTDILDAQARFVDPVALSAEERRAFVKCAWLPHTGESVEILESHFFVVAIGHLLRWLAQIPSVGGPDVSPEVSKAARSFESTVPRGTELRNMLEHEVEYIHGAGNEQSDYVKDVGGLPASAHCVSAIGLDGYVIGGRLDLPATMQSLQVLAPVLMAAQPADPPITFQINVHAVHPGEG